MVFEWHPWDSTGWNEEPLGATEGPAGKGGLQLSARDWPSFPLLLNAERLNISAGCYCCSTEVWKTIMNTYNWIQKKEIFIYWESYGDYLQRYLLRLPCSWLWTFRRCRIYSWNYPVPVHVLEFGDLNSHSLYFASSKSRVVRTRKGKNTQGVPLSSCLAAASHCVWGSFHHASYLSKVKQKLTCQHPLKLSPAPRASFSNQATCAKLGGREKVVPQEIHFSVREEKILKNILFLAWPNGSWVRASFNTFLFCWTARVCVLQLRNLPDEEGEMVQ